MRIYSRRMFFETFIIGNYECRICVGLAFARLACGELMGGFMENNMREEGGGGWQRGLERGREREEVIITFS